MDPDGRWTSTRAVLLAAAGQNCWPPAGSYMAATGQDLMAADSLKLKPIGMPPAFPSARPPRRNVWEASCPDRSQNKWAYQEVVYQYHDMLNVRSTQKGPGRSTLVESVSMTARSRTADLGFGSHLRTGPAGPRGASVLVSPDVSMVGENGSRACEVVLGNEPSADVVVTVAVAAGGDVAASTAVAVCVDLWGSTPTIMTQSLGDNG